MLTKLLETLSVPFVTNLFIARASFIAILTLFVLLTGLLLPGYLRGLQQEELSRIKEVFRSIRFTQAFASAESASQEFRLTEYLTPVLFTAFIVFVFSTVSLFGGAIPAIADAILAGTRLSNYHDGTAAALTFLRSYEEGTLTMVIFAFFGSFIWSVQYILRRVMTRDIAPGEFYSIGITMIFSVILSIAIRHSITAFFEPAIVEEIEPVLPSIGFLIGLFPNFFLEWLVARVRGRLFGAAREADDLGLKQIEGLSDFAVFRLKDLQIDNAQNLAYANPASIYMRTRFGLSETIDWVSQAQLLVLFKFDQTGLLRKHHVRNIADFLAIASSVGNANVLEAVAAELGTTVEELRVLAACVRNDPAVGRLLELRKALSAPLAISDEAVANTKLPASLSPAEAS